MKNKTKTYILLVAVLAIWGVIGYKIVFAVGSNETKHAEAPNFVAFRPKSNTVVDTFSVQTVDRDPFLGTLRIKQTKKITAIKKPEITWPPIKYHGSIKKKHKQNTIFIVSVSGTQYLIKRGQEIKEIKLINGNDRTITMRYNGVMKQIDKI